MSFRTAFAKTATFWMSQSSLDNKMMAAARSGDVKALNHWLDAGADIGHKDFAAVGAAAMSGHTETLKVLKSRGADLHAGPFGHRDYAVSAAATEGHSDTLEFLLNEGLDSRAVIPEGWALMRQRQQDATGPARDSYDRIVMLLNNPPTPEPVATRPETRQPRLL